MKIIAMTGNSHRHFAIVKALHQTGHLVQWVMEEREPSFPQPPPGLEPALETLFIRHFKERDVTERKFFPISLEDLKDIPRRTVSLEELNSGATGELLKSHNPDLLVSYGVHKLTPETLDCVKGHRWNCHGGLSPWYRGVITHFWPAYMLEPQMTGMTVHDLTQQIDAGDVIHQTASPMVRGDGVHDTACRAVAALASDLPRLIERLLQKQIQPSVAQKTTGRLWTVKDWRPEHLKIVYELYGNRMADAYLDGKFQGKPPKLVRQFE